ncbi:MAG: hypothetical protein ACK55Z_20120, partial [bacterium]
MARIAIQHLCREKQYDFVYLQRTFLLEVPWDATLHIGTVSFQVVSLLLLPCALDFCYNFFAAFCPKVVCQVG